MKGMGAVRAWKLGKGAKEGEDTRKLGGLGTTSQLAREKLRPLLAARELKVGNSYEVREVARGTGNGPDCLQSGSLSFPFPNAPEVPARYPLTITLLV